MDNEPCEQGTKDWLGCNWKKHMHCHGCGGAIYGLGFLGALVYYLSTATSILGGITGVIKAILWPAFLVYGIMKFLGM
ncbi:MAG TPA: hypothetical protein VMC42_06790 [Methanoregulaceae archaeon]|nr:hypothetical protein [Methanoregulaceae archaeon]